MMDISKLSDERKSVLLARAMGTAPEHDQIVPQWMIMIPGIAHNDKELEGCIFNLYEVDRDGNPIHIPLAWRVLNWALVDAPIKNKLNDWLDAITSMTDQNNFTKHAHQWWFLFALHPTDAIRELLDMILELAREAGIIEGDNELYLGQVEANDLEWNDPGIIKEE